MENKATSRPLSVIAKSSRLQAIKNKTLIAESNVTPDNKKHQQLLVTGLNKPTKDALLQAGVIIETRLSYILKNYPAGKIKTYFKIKYGMSVESMKLIAIEKSFKQLKLDSQTVQQFRLIAQLDFYGNNTTPVKSD